MKLAFLYGRFSLGQRPLDFKNLYTAPRGLTGSELSCVEYAQAMAARGHEVSLVVGQNFEPFEWRGIQLFPAKDPKVVDGCDAILSWNEPDLFREIAPGALRVMNQQLNDFGYCQPGWEGHVDLVTSPSAHHLEFLRKQAPGVKKWDVLPNGCDPAQYEEGHRIPGRVIWASSADRGLHRLLEAWPAIKARVPHASLRCFYNFQAAHFDDYEQAGLDNGNVHPDLLEIAQRKRYVQYAAARLADRRWDVEHVGSVGRQRMKMEFEHAEVLGYPCDTIRYCVTGDTLVDTERGLLRIDSLREAEGLRVASVDGGYSPIGKWFDSGDREVFAVRTRHGYEVSATGNHPLLVLTPSLTLVWREVGALRAGDHVCINKAAGSFNDRLAFEPFVYDRAKVTCSPEEKQLPRGMTPALATLLGYLVSEGAVGTHQIMFCNKDREVLREFDACWAECFPDTRLHAFDERRDDTPRREVHSQYVISFLRQIGLAPGDAYSKRVPWSILQADRASIAAFLGAYFEGDGSVSDYYTHVVSVSNELLRDVQLLLLKFGIVSVFHAREDEDRLGYVKIAGADNLVAFSEQVGFRSSRKKSRRQITGGARKPQLDKVPFVRAAVEALLEARAIEPAPHNQTRYRTDAGGEFITSLSAIVCGDGQYGRGSALTFREAIVECADRLAQVSESFAAKLRAVCDLPYLFDRVSTIESRGVQRTYDVSVPGPRAFTGNGIICHNTEGFSVTSMEACASGCLPVLTDIDSLGHIYGGAAPMVKLGGGTVGEGHLAEFIDLVVAGLTNPGWREAHVGMCRALAAQHAWPVLAEKLEDILTRALVAKNLANVTPIAAAKPKGKKGKRSKKHKRALHPPAEHRTTTVVGGGE